MNFDGFLFSLSPGQQPLAQLYDLMLMAKAAVRLGSFTFFLISKAPGQTQPLKLRFEMRKQKLLQLVEGLHMSFRVSRYQQEIPREQTHIKSPLSAAQAVKRDTLEAVSKEASAMWRSGVCWVW